MSTPASSVNSVAAIMSTPASSVNSPPEQKHRKTTRKTVQGRPLHLKRSRVNSPPLSVNSTPLGVNFESDHDEARPST
eukprot:8020243-Pyramimonas_sp.AAC.1